VVRAGEAPGLTAGAGRVGFGATVGCVGGAAATGTLGAATIVRGAGIASVLVADDELGASLRLATRSETFAAGSGIGSPMTAIAAIPTMTPSEVAATPAATSRNMTMHRLADWAPSWSMRRQRALQFPTVQGGPGLARGWPRLAKVGQGWPGLARVGECRRGSKLLTDASRQGGLRHCLARRPIGSEHGLAPIPQCYGLRIGIAKHALRDVRGWLCWSISCHRVGQG